MEQKYSTDVHTVFLCLFACLSIYLYIYICVSRHSFVIRGLYDDLSNPCQVCGSRCRDDACLADHLDWHLRMNKRKRTLQESQHKSQQFYWHANEWIEAEDVVFGVKKGPVSAQDQQNNTSQDLDLQSYFQTFIKKLPHNVPVPNDTNSQQTQEAKATCPVRKKHQQQTQQAHTK